MRSLRVVQYSLMLVGFLASSCSFHAPKVEVVCHELGLGYYQLVWETTPVIKGKVKIYISESPTQFRRIYPDRECSIEENTTSFFLPDSYQRKYFLLVFNNNIEVVTSNRVVKFDGVFNFRDIGGYETRNQRYTRWGMLYRSGTIGELSRNAQIRLANLRPYTVIDLRDRHPLVHESLEFPNIQFVNLPISGLDTRDIYERVMRNEFRRGDAMLFIQDNFRYYIDNNHSSLFELFEILSTPQNYPIIIQGEFGKDRVSVVMALIQLMLGVTEDFIIDDYTLSNQNLEYLFKMEKEMADLSAATQEAVTTLHTSHEVSIRDLLRYIEDRYGSADHYFEEVLNIDRTKRNEIRSILLTPGKK